MFANLCLIIHFASTWAMVGLIWIVQLVHYPMFGCLDAAQFSRHMRDHQQQISWIVLPLMMSELLSGLAMVVPPTCNSVFMGGRRELVASARLGIDLPNPGPAAHTAAQRIRCRGLQTARKLELDSNRCLVPAWNSCRVHGLAVAEIVFCPGRTWIEPLSLRSASRRIEQVCRSRWTFRYSGLL